MYKSESPQSAKLTFEPRHRTVVSVKEEPAVNSKQQIQSENPSKSSRSQSVSLLQFDQLPDTAYVRLPVVLALFGCSRATWYRWVKSGRVPAPKKLSSRISVNQVGSLRVCLKNFEASGQLGSIEGDGK